jgi:hypothetical protein
MGREDRGKDPIGPASISPVFIMAKDKQKMSLADTNDRGRPSVGRRKIGASGSRVSSVSPPRGSSSRAGSSERRYRPIAPAPVPEMSGQVAPTGPPLQRRSTFNNDEPAIKGTSLYIPEKGKRPIVPLIGPVPEGKKKFATRTQSVSPPLLQHPQPVLPPLKFLTSPENRTSFMGSASTGFGCRVQDLITGA